MVKTCTPLSPAGLCGTWPDGCGGVLNAGACSVTSSCSNYYVPPGYGGPGVTGAESLTEITVAVAPQTTSMLELVNGQWAFLLDSNNQRGLVGRYEDDAMEELLSYRPAKIRLIDNCRNTVEIVADTQSTEP